MLAPSPHASAHDAEFWAAAKEGQLVLQRCKETGKFQHYPRAHSIHAAKADLEWAPSEGHGAVHTFTVISRSFFKNLESPMVLAVVDLDEGVRMTTHIVNIDPDKVEIGLRVIAKFIERDGENPVLVFVPEN